MGSTVLALLILIAFCSAQSTNYVCVPTAMNVTYTPFRSAATRTHLITSVSDPSSVVHLVASEWATGNSVLFVSDVTFVSAFVVSRDATFLAYRKKSDLSLWTSDPLGTNAVQISPANVTVSSGYSFTPNSAQVIFQDVTGSSLSGIWTAPARGGAAAVRISLPDHTGFTAFVVTVSPDSTTVAYLATNATLAQLYIAKVGVASSAVMVQTGTSLPSTSATFSDLSDQFLFTATSATKSRVYVVPLATVATATPLEVTPVFGPNDQMGGISPQFTTDGSRVVFGIILSGSSQALYAAIPTVANSGYQISLPATSAVSNSIFTISGANVVYVVKATGEPATALWSVNAVTNVTTRLSPFNPTATLGISGPIFTSAQATYVGFTGDFITSGQVDAFIVPNTGPSSAAIRINQASPACCTRIFPNNRATYQYSSQLFVTDIVAPGVVSVARAASLNGDTAVLLYFQPNGVSAAYQNSVGRVATTCLVDPTIVGANNTLFLNTTTQVQGHLIVNGGTVVVTASGGGANVAGSAVLSGTLQVPCQSGTFNVINATYIVGSFGQVTTSCQQSCQTATTTVSGTSSSLSVTVSVVSTCGGGGEARLSTGAIVGIAIGCSAFVVAVVLVFIFTCKYIRQQRAVQDVKMLPRV